MSDTAALLGRVEKALTPADLPALRTRQLELGAAKEIMIQNRTKLVAKVASGLFTEDEAMSTMTDIRSRLAETEAQLGDLRRKLDSANIPHLAEVVGAISAEWQRFREMPRPQRKALLSKYVSGVHVDKDLKIKAINIKLNAVKTGNSSGCGCTILRNRSVSSGLIEESIVKTSILRFFVTQGHGTGFVLSRVRVHSV
jgi:hypothetical protein